MATILLMPFYVFSAGNPQPSDAVLVAILGLPILALRPSLPSSVARPVIALVAFTLYVALCNLSWAAITARTDFLRSTLFYVFNLMVFVGYLVLTGYRGDAWLRATAYGFAASILMLTVLALAGGRTTGGRLVLYFNNPNQLAYYVLMSVTLVVVLAKRANLSAAVLIGLMAAAAYLEYRGHSRAGAAGLLLLLGFYLARNPLALALVAIPLFIVSLYYDPTDVDDPLWQARVSNVESNSLAHFAEERGLDRIVDNPRYLLLGAGEGDYLRFNPNKLEVHSSAASIVFCYGVVGAGLFIVFAVRVLRAGELRTALMLMPALGYGLFHNGMRFRPFWVLLAVVVAYGVIVRIERARDGPRAASSGAASSGAASPGGR